MPPPPFACFVGRGGPGGRFCRDETRLFGALACLLGCTTAGLLPALLLDVARGDDVSATLSGAGPGCDEVGASSSHAGAELLLPSSSSSSLHFFNGLL
jgi:hypothetical protein